MKEKIKELLNEVKKSIEDKPLNDLGIEYSKIDGEYFEKVFKKKCEEILNNKEFEDVISSYNLDIDKLDYGAAYDDIRETLIVFPKGRCIVPVGLFTSFPPGYEIQIRPRSGLAIKHGITVVNSPGTIDSKENFNFKYITN